MAIDFGELASRYASNRLDQAMQPFTDPEAYMNQRMTNDFGVDMNGNTKPVSTTINYGENGTPETITTKREVGQSQPQEYSAPANYALPTPQGGGLGIQAPQYAAPVGVPQPQQAMPQAVNPQQLADEERRKQAEAQAQAIAQAHAQQQAQQEAAARAQQPAPTPVQVQQPAPAPQIAQAPAQVASTAGPVAQPTMGAGAGTPQTAPVAPINPSAPVPNIGQLPTPGPAVQVAGPQTAGLTEAARAQQAQQAQQQSIDNNPATQTPDVAWAKDLQNIKDDEDSLYTYAGNKQNDPAARAVAKEMLVKLADRQKETVRADKIVQGVAAGDAKATNEFVKEIKSTEGSWVKAILFARLGLNDLAKEEQQKLGAGAKFGKAMMNGQGYAVEENGQGAIVRAWKNGKSVDDTTLAALNENSMKQGTHAFGFTGEAGIDPKSGEEVGRRSNSITGAQEYVYVTGPKKGEVYTGSTPIAKSVQTTGQKKELTERISSNWAGPIAANRASGSFTGKFNAENNANIAIRHYGGGRAEYVDLNNGGTTVVPHNGKVDFVPNSPAQTAAAVGGATPPAERLSPSSTPKAQPAPRLGEPGFEGETPAAFQARRKAWEDSNKKIVEQESAKQYAAQNVYPVVRDINDALKKSTGSGIGAKVDDIAAYFGHSTEGAQAVAKLQVLGDTLTKSVPRFQGPQSDKDVASYQAAAGQLANRETPIATRVEAFKTIVALNKKYAPELDWDFKSEDTPASRARAELERRRRGQ